MKPLLFRLLSVMIFVSAPLHAEVLECTVKSHHETTDDGLLAPSVDSIYIGRVFRVDVNTGEISGDPADNKNVPDRTIKIVDPGRAGMSVTIITTRGGAFGYVADLLVIKTWVKQREKPFQYVDANFGFFTGTCVRL